MRALMLCVLGGCLYEEKTFSEPFACLGGPEPTSASRNMVVSGAVVDANTKTPLAGVPVTFLEQNQGTIEGPEPSRGDGGYQFTLDNGGLPVRRFYIKAEASGGVTTFQANSRPFTGDVTLAVPVVSTPNAQALAPAIGGPLVSATAGAAFLNVLDCNLDPVAGASVTATGPGGPVGTVFYFEGNMPPQSATTETDEVGVVLFTNLPPGPVTFQITAGSRTYPMQSFIVSENALLQFDYTPHTPVN